MRIEVVTIFIFFLHDCYCTLVILQVDSLQRELAGLFYLPKVRCANTHKAYIYIIGNLATLHMLYLCPFQNTKNILCSAHEEDEYSLARNHALRKTTRFRIRSVGGSATLSKTNKRRFQALEEPNVQSKLILLKLSKSLLHSIQVPTASPAWYRTCMPDRSGNIKRVSSAYWC